MAVTLCCYFNWYTLQSHSYSILTVTPCGAHALHKHLLLVLLNRVQCSRGRVHLCFVVSPTRRSTWGLGLCPIYLCISSAQQFCMKLSQCLLNKVIINGEGCVFHWFSEVRGWYPASRNSKSTRECFTAPIISSWRLRPVFYSFLYPHYLT
jgi:hypothetical protein